MDLRDRDTMALADLSPDSITIYDGDIRAFKMVQISVRAQISQIRLCSLDDPDRLAIPHSGPGLIDDQV